MYAHTIAAAAALAFAAYAEAQGNMIIINKCQQPVHLESTTTGKIYDIEKTLQPGEQYSETYRINPNGGGISLKLAFPDDLTDITQMEYTWTPATNLIWYDLSNINGQPFMPYGMDLVPSIDCCVRPSCVAGVSACPMAYFHPKDDWNSHTCKESIDLTLNLCVSRKPTYGNVYYPTAELPTECSAQAGGDAGSGPSASSQSPAAAPAPASTPLPSSTAPVSYSSSSPTTASAAASSGLGLGGIHLQENAAVSSTSTPVITSMLTTTEAPGASLLSGQSIISTSTYTQGQVAYEVVVIQQEVTVTSASATVIVQSTPTPAVGRRHDHNKRHNMHRHHNRGN